MNNISSFLEADSFLSPPPLRKVDKRFPLDHLSTVELGETQGNVFEFGIVYLLHYDHAYKASLYQSSFLRTYWLSWTGNFIVS